MKDFHFSRSAFHLYFSFQSDHVQFTDFFSGRLFDYFVFSLSLCEVCSGLVQCVLRDSESCVKYCPALIQSLSVGTSPNKWLLFSCRMKSVVLVYTDLHIFLTGSEVIL